MGTVNNNRPRRPWVAFLLSLLSPGLGHVYNNDLIGGAVRYVAVTMVAGAVMVAWAYRERLRVRLDFVDFARPPLIRC